MGIPKRALVRQCLEFGLLLLGATRDAGVCIGKGENGNGRTSSDLKSLHHTCVSLLVGTWVGCLVARL